MFMQPVTAFEARQRPARRPALAHRLAALAFVALCAVVMVPWLAVIALFSGVVLLIKGAGSIVREASASLDWVGGQLFARR